MNIKKDHILDKDLLHNLLNSSFIKIPIGSTMYGLEHENSDTDLLYVYNTSDDELNSIIRSHHQIQFKFNNTDHIFVNIHTFIANALSGDSTINFEVINSEVLVGTELEFLYKFRKYFYNYKIIRSYLGLARRDLKRINIDGKTNFDKNKKIAHAFRGLATAMSIYNIAYGDKSDTKIFLSDSDRETIKTKIWELKDHNARSKHIDALMELINEVRSEINKEYDKGVITSYMKVDHQGYLNSALSHLLEETTTYKMVFENLVDFYKANEFGV